jgi:cytochrome c oxidase assembly protein subunit 15
VSPIAGSQSTMSTLAASSPDVASGPNAPWLHRYAVLVAAATLALIFIGGLVTSTGSGLSVPDWPLSYGMLMPPMVGGVFYEHTHRLAAASVGVLTLVLAFWTARRERRGYVRWLAWGALGAVVLQGVLGGLTVLFLLPLPVSVAHGSLAQTFLCLLVAVAYVTSREWTQIERPTLDAAGLRSAAAVATVAVYLQLLLGAVMRHMRAGLAIPDFPLAFGRLLPPFADPHVVVNFAHRLMGLVVLATIVRLWWRARRAGEPRLGAMAGLVLGLGLLQVALGATTVWSARAVIPTTLHVANGAATLAATWLLTLRTRRLLAPPPAGEAAGSVGA